MFVKITNGQVDKYPYTIGDLRKENPNTSFPKNIPDELLAQFDVFPVSYSVEPSFDPITQRIETSSQPSLVDGKWVLTKTVVNKTQEQIDSHNARKAFITRSERDKELEDTDWMVIKAAETGTTLATEWATYRQALRDIPSQEGFPWSVTWPTKPE